MSTDPQTLGEPALDAELSPQTGPCAARPVRWFETPLVWVAPRRLFRRVEDVAVYGWPLLILLTAVTMLGYATIQTGLIDRAVDRSVAARIAALDATQRDVVERSALRELYAQQVQQGEFEKTLARVRAVAAQPIGLLAATLLTASVLYGVVALSGRKPEWNTLMNICVLAAFVELLRLGVNCALMMRFQTLEVDASAAPVAVWLRDLFELGPQALAATAGALTALDPFRIWYWIVVVAGLQVTCLVAGWRAWAVCGGCWLLAAGVRAGLAAAATGAAEG